MDRGTKNLELAIN